MKPNNIYLNENEKKATTLFVSRAKNRLGKNMVDMKIFGSKIRGDFHSESDIDILIVVRNRNITVRNEISEIVSELNIDFDCIISPVIYTEDEYKRNQYCKTLFAENLAKQGVGL